MLPLSLLNSAVGHTMIVELKSGQTYNGHLISCDSWMNVIATSADATEFCKIAEIYIKGNSIKHLRIPDEVIDKVRSGQLKDRKEGGRGGQTSAGRGRGGQSRDVRGRGGARGGGSSSRGRGDRGGGRGGDRGARGSSRGGRGGRGRD